MEALAGSTANPGDFRLRVTLAIAYAGLIFLGPFALNNLWQERWTVGVLSILIILELVALAWSIRGERPSATWLTWLLIPMVLGFLATSIERQGMIGIFWCYPGVLAFCSVLSLRLSVVANSLLLFMVALLARDVLPVAEWMRLMVTLLSVAVFISLFVSVIERQQSVLARIADTDVLTGLLNRNRLHRALRSVMRLGLPCRRPASLLMIDIDFFKRINDLHGHAVGDQVLRQVAQAFKRQTRDSDQAFRLGGEECLLILHDCDEASASGRAEAIRLHIAQLPLSREQRVTVSIGVAEWNGRESAEAWVARCDAALYLAKSKGRNRVERTLPAAPAAPPTLSTGQAIPAGSMQAG